MRKSAKNKFFIAGLLLILFAIPQIITSIHIQQHHVDSCHEEQLPTHNCDDCQVCQFSYSFFTETELVEWSSPKEISPIRPIIYQEHSYCSSFTAFFQRGPPEILGQYS